MVRVLEFPKNKIIRTTTISNETLEGMKAKGLKNFADSLIEDVSSDLMAALDNYGIDTDQANFSKDYIFLTEVITALVYRTLKLEHSLHQFIDSNVELVKEDMEETTEEE